MTSRLVAGAPRVDAVLPVLLRDLDRFEILDASIRKFFAPLGRCWVVAADHELAQVRRRVVGEPYQVIAESSLFPELAQYRRLYRKLDVDKSRRDPLSRLRRRCIARFCNVRGWYIQQILKMAAAQVVETPYYLTLDADVICVRPVRSQDLFVGGKALVNTTSEDWHPDWYRNSERVLGLARSGLTHGVTPALLHRDAMTALFAHLQARVAAPLRAGQVIAGRHSSIGRALGSWRSYLLRNTPWTEYSLYYTYLEATGQFDRYHVAGGRDAVCDNYGSVWSAADFAARTLDDFLRSPAPFRVVQSTTGIPPAQLWSFLGGILENAPRESV
jgi:hypothetical protein